MTLPHPSLEALRAIERRAPAGKDSKLRLVCVGAPRLNSYGVGVQLIQEGSATGHVDLGEDLVAVLGAYGNQVAESYGIPGVEVHWPAGGEPVAVLPLRDTDGIVVDTLFALIDNYARLKSHGVARRKMVMARDGKPVTRGTVH